MTGNTTLIWAWGLVAILAGIVAESLGVSQLQAGTYAGLVIILADRYARDRC